MTVRQFFIFISLVILTFDLCMEALHVPTVCLGSFGKCPGFMPFDNGYFHPTNNTPPLSQFTTDAADKCRTACIEHNECFFAEYRHSFKLCLLHQNGKIVMNGERGKFATLYRWGCCLKRELHCIKFKDHCSGYWIHYKNWYLNRTNLQPLQVLVGIRDETACRSVCMKHSLCNTIGFHVTDESVSLAGTCSLYAHYRPLTQSDVTTVTGRCVSKWTCCDRDDRDLRKNCRASKHLCNGYWSPDLRQRPHSNKTTLGLFHSGSKFVCMTACERHPSCFRVFYNASFSQCLMKGEDAVDWRTPSENQTALVHSFEYDAYKWTCCKASDALLHTIPESVTSDYRSCVCPNTNFFTLASDVCGSLNESKILRMNSSLAAFWIMEKDEREVRRGNNTWTRVNNGANFVWINKSRSQLVSCSVHECNVFSTVIRPNKCPHTVTVRKWFGNPPKKTQSFVKTPTMISILNTYKPNFRCFSRVSCSDYVRSFQKFHQVYLNWWDVAYNFLIGDDGSVYVGRGSNVTGAHTGTFNSVSYGIAFIGWFRYETPSVTSLRTAKELIACLAKKAFLSKDYTVHAHRDLRPSEIPGTILYEIMQNWPHYRGFISETDCPQPPYLVIFLSVAVISLLFIISVVLFIQVCRIYRHQSWCPRRLPSFFLEVAISAAGSGWKETIGEEREWPTACVIRVPNYFSIDPLDTTLGILYDHNEVCPCLRHLCLLWCRCQVQNTFSFVSLIHSDIPTIGRCRHQTLFVLRPGVKTAAFLYVLHFSSRQTLHDIATCILKQDCVCRSTHVTHQSSITPPLSLIRSMGVDEMEAANGRKRFSSMLVDKFNINDSLEAYTLLFLSEGRHRREVTYSQWINEQEQMSTMSRKVSGQSSLGSFSATCGNTTNRTSFESIAIDFPAESSI